MVLGSVIIHCDLDCFYAQVERERLKLPLDACIAVVQWSMVLAVSYPARKYGIKRGFKTSDIQKAAGDKVTVVEVETIGSTSKTTEDDAGQASDDTQGREKVSLERYRKASANVFAAIVESLQGYDAKLERASIDEAYIDVSAAVDRRMRVQAGAKEFPAETMVVGDKLDLSSESDMRLAHGADIAREIRRKVFQSCNYTMSAGISMNKLLAKFASAKNKPNKQTIVPLGSVSELMRDVPLRKLRGLGGKLGSLIESMGVSTAGEATRFTMAELTEKLGRHKDAEFVYNCVRGVDKSTVVERDTTKSILAAKSFKPEMSLDILERQWLPLLSDELVQRMRFDTSINNRDARTIVISFRARPKGQSRGFTAASRSIPMPPDSNDSWAKTLAKASLAVMNSVMFKDGRFCFPINFIGLTATNFQNRAKSGESICNYFSASASSKDDTSTKTEKQTSHLSKDGEHKRRIQERSDRELALRLHREENSGIKKPSKKGAATAKGSNKRKSSQTKGKRGSSSGNMTMDMFFKTRSNSTKK